MAADAEPSRARDAVAVILAIGVATAINIITLAALYDAVTSDEAGLSENATQILTGAFGGVLGVLAAYLGYRAGAASVNGAATPPTPSRVDPDEGPPTGPPAP